MLNNKQQLSAAPFDHTLFLTPDHMRSSGTVSQLSRPDNMSCEKCESFRLLTVNWSSFFIICRAKETCCVADKQTIATWNRVIETFKKAKRASLRKFRNIDHCLSAACENCCVWIVRIRSSFYELVLHLHSYSSPHSGLVSAPPPFFGVLSGSKMNLRALMCDILDAISYVHATFHFTFSHSHHVSL